MKSKEQICHEIELYFKGKRDGVFDYAYQKDGVYYVGTCGLTLEKAFNIIDDEERAFLSKEGFTRQ